MDKHINMYKILLAACSLLCTHANKYNEKARNTSISTFTTPPLHHHHHYYTFLTAIYEYVLVSIQTHNLSELKLG